VKYIPARQACSFFGLFSCVVLALAILDICSPMFVSWSTAYAQDMSSTGSLENGDSEEEMSVYQKVVRWARPSLDATKIDAVIEEIELNSSKYGLDLDFSVAFIAAEASLHPVQGFSRQWSSVMELKRVYSYGKLDAPPVWDDLPNTISTMRMAIDETKTLPKYSDRTLKSALARYWMGPAKGINVDTFERFYSVFKEKFKAILIAHDRESVISQAGKAVIPDDLSGFVSHLPRMSELDNRIRSWPIEDAYVNAIQGFNPRLDDDLALLIARAILSFSHDTGIDPRLVIALVEAESAFNPRATSTKGAMGLGQLMPATAKSFGIRDPYEPVQNIYVCVSYLERDFYRFQGKANILDLVLAAYNAGPGAVRKYGGVPPYRETQNYVRKVKSLYAKLAG